MSEQQTLQAAQATNILAAAIASAEMHGLLYALRRDTDKRDFTVFDQAIHTDEILGVLYVNINDHQIYAESNGDEKFQRFIETVHKTLQKSAFVRMHGEIIETDIPAAQAGGMH